MNRPWRRIWPIAALALACGVGWGAQLAVERLTRDPPNYSHIEVGLWLGGFVTAPPPGTAAVLNLSETRDPYQAESHRWEPIPDAEPAPSLDWLHEQVRFIESERENGRTVYVHCRNGVSRSGMVLTAYFMQREHWSRDQALSFLRTRRPGVRPNPAFMDLLATWEEMCARAESPQQDSPEQVERREPRSVAPGLLR